MTPRRIAIIMPWGTRVGGSETMMWTWLSNADVAHFDLRVAFLQAGRFERDVAALGFRTASATAGRLREPTRVASTIAQLASIFRGWQPELVLNWSPKAHLYGASAAAVARVRSVLVWWQHDLPRRHWMDRLATLLPAAAIGCSSQVSQRAQQRLWPRRSTFVVHPGIEVDNRSGRAVAKLDIPDGRVVIGMVARLQPWKGQHHLVEALARLRAAGQDVHGLLVGGSALGLSSDYGPRLHALIDQYGLGDRVTLTGQVADVDAYLRRMDVFVSASTVEPFGVSILEAMAQSLPIVGSAQGGAGEIVLDGVTGQLLDSLDATALAAALSPLVGDPARRAAMGAAGHRRCERVFGATQMAAQLQDRLEELLGAA